MKVKPKLQWRPRDAGDARTMRHPQKRAAGIEWDLPKRETVPAVDEVEGARLLKSLGALDAGHAVQVLVFSRLHFSLALLPSFSATSQLLPVGMGMFTLCRCVLEACNLFPDDRSSQVSECLQAGHSGTCL